MKKTVTVNISGAIFHIDEDAFDKLNIYLNTIRNYFSSSEGRDEILGDIEARIAEMLREKIIDNKQVITIEDIEKVISIMGEPEQVAGEDAKKEGNKSHEPITSKRFYRDPDNSILGGVCGGIAAYFNIKSMWVRIAFILFSLAYGSGFLIYLLLWVIIPKALTTAEKLEMKGEKINISNIEKSINEEITQIKTKFSDLKDEAKGVYARNKEIPKNTFEKILMLFFQILKYFIKTVAIIVGIIFIVVGIFLITGFIFSFFKTDDIVYISSMGVSSFSIPVFLKILLTSSSQITLAMIGLSLLIGIPLLMLIYNGTKLIFGFRTKFRFVGLSSFSLWLTGLVLCGIVALQVTRSFSHKYVKTQNVNLIQPIKNTLYLDLKPDNSIDSLKSYDEKFLLGQWNMVTANGKNIHFGIPNLEFIKSETDSFNLLIFYSARGENRDIAMQRTNLIDYKFVQKDSVLLFNPYFYLPVKEKWRNQNVRILLKIPVGKSIFIKKNMGILLNNPNSDSTNSELINKKWIMQEGGLKVPTYFAPVQTKVDSSKIDKKPILNTKIK